MAVAVEVADGQADGLIGPLVWLERAVTIALDDQQVALCVADHQVGNAVAVDVPHGHAGRIVAGVDQGHRDKIPFAVVQENRDILASLIEDDEVRQAVVGQGSGHDLRRVDTGHETRRQGRVGELAVRCALEKREAVGPALYRHDVGESGVTENAGRDAHRLVVGVRDPGRHPQRGRPRHPDRRRATPRGRTDGRDRHRRR